MKKESQKLLTIALPAMVEQCLHMLTGFIDNYLVAQLGLVAVSGVAIANNLIAVYQALFIALSAVISSLLSRYRAQGQSQKHLQGIADALCLTSLIGISLGLLSLFGNSWLLSRLGTPTPVAQEGGRYLAIVGGGIISLSLLTSMGAIVRIQGYAKLPMQISLLTNGLNALLSTLAIYVCHLGIVGVALATVIARLVGVLLLMRKLPLVAILRRLRLAIDKSLLQMALPAAGERLMMRIGDLLLISIIVTFGTDVVAGNAVGETLTQFNYLPAMAIAVATVIEVASHTREHPRKARKVVVTSFYLSTLMMFCLAAPLFLLKFPLTSFFLTNPQALVASHVSISYSLIGVPVTAGTLIMTATWQGLGNAKLPFYATSVGMWIIRIGLGYVLGVTQHMGLEGVWLATILDNLFRCFFLTYLYHKKETATTIRSL